MDAWVQPQARLCGIFGALNGLGTGFFLVFWFSPVGYIPPVLHAHSSTRNAMYS